MTDETTIPNEFKKYGSIYSLLKRSGRVVAYRSRREESGKISGYEVMVIQQRKPSVITDKKGVQHQMRGGESLPSSSLWGIFGWSYLPTQEAEMDAKFARSCIHFNPQPVAKKKKKKVKPTRRLVREW